MRDLSRDLPYDRNLPICGCAATVQLWMAVTMFHDHSFHVPHLPPAARSPPIPPPATNSPPRPRSAPSPPRPASRSGRRADTDPRIRPPRRHRSWIRPPRCLPLLLTYPPPRPHEGMPSPRAPRSAATGGPPAHLPFLSSSPSFSLTPSLSVLLQVPAMAIMDSSHAAGARHRSPPSTVRPESGRETRPSPRAQIRCSNLEVRRRHLGRFN